ncbi:type II toxin-antitoxin system RelE/ParE family toxin [[Clostridium] scindens]|uniref:type II toxin-antitoxin system RelE/ParE family toxin n=1 Tax=Clostridium scindens (strain JCM 10418 / VPI 12708) TaxID=29347 RepID=UPI002676F140|nr:type II toxin-antitoxin system RelE/ParE family toxin [[Clostridium] scindens]
MTIYYTPESRDDLQKVKESVIEKFDSTELAEKVLCQIIKDINNLKVFPYMGRTLTEVLSSTSGYRFLFCQHNYIFYRVEKDTVRIVRILNEKQDYMRALFGISEDE